MREAMRGVDRAPFANRYREAVDRLNRATDADLAPGARPFGLPGDSLEIILDLPMPVSGNRMNRNVRGRTKPFPSPEHLAWRREADMLVMATRQFPKRKITGNYEMLIYLNVTVVRRSDGDNRQKPIGDWLQKNGIVRNDSDCRRWYGEWVEPEKAPAGCRVILRTLENHV